ncbi:MAG TPA: YkgJ family cysteine cluster protein [Candidatus Omnitrophota bacterium]|nr:YkgJ family cysteine cluster protein [Candidatus Omnitrophota bacterium]HPB67308.1 YkgJ family cysteine cluster protein [Candidatus Omnitrophota bacterium]HQO58805.1 YkgJ family cysteine cluster protein [Candidatus Omnitrophota bacterium]HQP11851.1 YkgJ family cysteine cluster protein [Candidatus Omnitrophota bacterium]
MLKQFVPSLVCLSCEGCCRFQEADSPWRPKVGPGEKKDFEARLPAGAPGSDVLDSGVYVTAKRDGVISRCRFLDRAANTCDIYPGRPLECRLYPFLLVRSGGRTLVALHLSCPFAQKYYGLKDMDDYIAYLKGVFSQPPMTEFLRDNRALFSDYSLAAEEWVPVFDLDVPGGPDGS